MSSFGRTERITLVQKLNQWVSFSISLLKLNEFIDRRPRGLGFLCGFSIAGNWSRYNLCDIVTKDSVVSTDPDVHFKCCISADSKVQASIKHETKGKPIQACRVHSGALDELTSHQSTGKCSLLLFFKFGHIAHKFLVVIRLVVVQDSVVK